MKGIAKEFFIEGNKLYLGDDGIVYSINIGNDDEKKANATKEAYFKLIESIDGKTNVFVDLDKAGKPSVSARNIWKELLEHEKTGKVAIFGLHPVARVLASFVVGISRKKDVRFFKSEEEALAWLKER